MKIRYKLSLVATTFLVLSACSKAPHKIDYGNDGCHFCKMTIVDKIHGSELISDTGKVFKFDATECMLSYVDENKELLIGSLLTNYYEDPTKFLSTQEATFLISEKLPSPMGANLTAFKTKESAEKVLTEKGGELYSWEALKVYLNQ
jgi:copper chaperone NosL